MNHALIISVSIMLVCVIIIMIVAGNAKTDTEIFDYDINELDQKEKHCTTLPDGKKPEPGHNKALMTHPPLPLKKYPLSLQAPPSSPKTSK